MNPNYDRIAALKTALGNMHPQTARDILEAFSAIGENLTSLVEWLGCEANGAKGEPAAALKEELTIAEEALEVLCESSLPVILQEQAVAEQATTPTQG